jgi:exodeoxyribonuclease VII large subunit
MTAWRRERNTQAGASRRLPDQPMTERIYLTTPYSEKDQAKELGARWDAAARQWFVPPGLDLAPFAAWLPATAAVVAEPPARSDWAPAAPTRALDTAVQGIPLSRLLGGVAALVANTFTEGVWTTAEVLRASNSKGHCYLELSERGPQGEVLAQARAVIWARTAQTLLAEFQRATGAELDAGIKVLVRAKPVFKAQFGFSLEIDAIEPSYTLGDLEAKKREIRERLKREGLFERNRQLPAPWDYEAVLVVAPERAAGLGDFANDAQHLQAHGVCEFSYVASRFQGEGAAAEIVRALEDGLRAWSAARLPDAVVVIRGGGSVNDLAWLNDYALARCICECPVPVLTGIGHERDDTSIDEVAHRRFDTPSKVIAGIRDLVQLRTREAQTSHDTILGLASAQLGAAATQAEQLAQTIQAAARTAVVQARSASDTGFQAVRAEAVGALHQAQMASRQRYEQVCADARLQLATAQQQVPAALEQIRSLASAQVQQARQTVRTLAPDVLERAAAQARHARRDAQAHMDDVVERAGRSVASARERAEALFREIAGQGPQKTLQRGFAVVRHADGRTITSSHDVPAGAPIVVQLHDGSLPALAQPNTPT